MQCCRTPRRDSGITYPIYQMEIRIGETPLTSSDTTFGLRICFRRARNSGALSRSQAPQILARGAAYRHRLSYGRVPRANDIRNGRLWSEFRHCVLDGSSRVDARGPAVIRRWTERRLERCLGQRPWGRACHHPSGPGDTVPSP